MGLAATATADRLVVMDELLVHVEVRHRHEEPFTLADEGAIVPAGALALVEATMVGGSAHFGRLQGEFRLHDGRSATGHGGDEPLALIVSAQKAIIRGRCFDEEQEVAIMPVALEHSDVELWFALGGNLQLEPLTEFVGGEIERIVRAAARARQIFWTNDPEPSAHVGELVRNRFRIHKW
jgi:hypothetical protein